MFQADYSAVDRMVHNLAMSQFDVQKLISSIEDRKFNQTNAGIDAARPVFITSLPRAGTTLLLQLIAEIGDFASHTYRDMPFLLCPLTWNQLSRKFHKRGREQERAHGDGMTVSYDSVEAFEEILWRAFWPEHFVADRIHPWQPLEQDEEGSFLDFLRQHMRKIIWLTRQRRDSCLPQRYVSKNNANIARLGWIEEHFPDAKVLIPYRAPGAHIRSLLRQHLNFLESHAQDPFVLRYMETIGHFEFGQALRPINFDNWLEQSPNLDPTTPDFWAEYWTIAFEAVLRNAGPGAIVFSYDRLCAAPNAGLEALETQLQIESNSLLSAASRFRSPTQYDDELTGIAPERRRRLEKIHAELQARALF